MTALAIADYALVGDLQTAALVGCDGSMDWLCLPRFDSPACFAALLDSPDAGRWLIRPAAQRATATRAYRGDTLILETTWETEDGAVRVIDFMPPRGRNPDLVRLVEGLSGTVRLTCELAVRFDYGHVIPWLHRESRRWTAVAGPDSLVLDTPVRLADRGAAAEATFEVHAGDRVPFVLTWGPSYEDLPVPVDAERSLQQTEDYWRRWIDGCTYQGKYQDAVRRSLLTLKALTYAPTGGIAAAATTSLPERIGGRRNWDYRFCWLRDAAFTLQALASAGFTDEAAAWRDWLLRAVAGDPADVQVMYSLTGRRRLPELDLDWLAGYRGSTPVRIGNGAASQFQLDVYGKVLDGLHAAREAGLSADGTAWNLQCALAGHVEKVWRDPDCSLWEMRGPRRHFVHSKVMAWVALDRMIRTARKSHLPGPVTRWERARHAIHAEVCARGFDRERGTFTQFYGSRGLDAALLLLPRVGFLPADDPRVVGTIDAVRRELSIGPDGFIARYRPDADPHGEHDTVDGLPGDEGAFVVCTFWLADALALTGRRDEACELLEHLLAVRNDVGLLSEEWDPALGLQLGNTPQAFSHVGLINTAIGLDTAGFE